MNPIGILNQTKGIIKQLWMNCEKKSFKNWIDLDSKKPRHSIFGDAPISYTAIILKDDPYLFSQIIDTDILVF